jgi:hypothetical protein
VSTEGISVEATADLILTVHSSLDITRLNKCYDVLLNLFNSPSKCGAHPIKLNGGEGLEVEYDGPVAD